MHTQVLKHLQREKKRALARSEEHYVNRSLYCLTSSSSLRETLIKVFLSLVSQCAAVCCSALQCVAVCCSVLQ